MEGIAGPDKTPSRIAGMFDAIAPRYDLLNRVLSAGLDRRWRERAVDALELPQGARVLDLCTGTADLAVATVRRVPGASVVGVDFAGAMLRLGLAKIASLGLGRSIQLVRGDATRIPVGSATCDAATIAFGIRNVAEPERALAEIARVLRPHGRLAILEFGQPADSRHPFALFLVFSLRAAGDRPAGLETQQRLLVPAGVGRHVSSAAGIRGNNREAGLL